MSNTFRISSGLHMLIENGTTYKGDGNSPVKANVGIGADKAIRVAVHLSQFKLYKPTLGVTSDQILELLYRARKDGVNITASQNPYPSIGGALNAYFIGHLLSNTGCVPDCEALGDIHI